jgi:hypothetical protein
VVCATIRSNERVAVGIVNGTSIAHEAVVCAAASSATGARLGCRRHCRSEMPWV